MTTATRATRVQMGLIRVTYLESQLTLDSLSLVLNQLTNLIGIADRRYADALAPPSDMTIPTLPGTRPRPTGPRENVSSNVIRSVNYNSPLEIIFYMTSGGSALLALANKWAKVRSNIAISSTTVDTERSKRRELRRKEAQEVIDDYIRRTLPPAVDPEAMREYANSAANALADIEEVRSVTED